MYSRLHHYLLYQQQPIAQLLLHQPIAMPALGLYSIGEFLWLVQSILSFFDL